MGFGRLSKDLLKASRRLIEFLMELMVCLHQAVRGLGTLGIDGLRIAYTGASVSKL